MSSCLTSEISDHLTDLEQSHGEESQLVSAESGPREVMATRVAVREGRVVFDEKDEKMWVYRSYPIAIGPRPGVATDLRVPAWTFRATLVEPYNLAESAAFKGCSAVYAIGPSVAGWWESAPFTLRKNDRLEFDRLETSLLSLPSGCEVEALGAWRAVPTTGYLRHAGTDKQRDASNQVDIRSALMLDPLRLAPAHVTGRRSRARGESGDDGAERWHWGIVPDLDATLDLLLKDPELDRFRESVMDPEGDFLARWYRAANDVIPVQSGPVAEWGPEARERWWLEEAERDPKYVGDLLREAARYALAGPVDLKAYQKKCQDWDCAGRRAAWQKGGAALVFPLVQNIFVDWYAARHSRGLVFPTARGSRTGHGVPQRREAAGFRRELVQLRDRFGLMDSAELGRTIGDAVACLNRRRDGGRSDVGGGVEMDEETGADPAESAHPHLLAIQAIAASIAWMEDRLLNLDRELPLSPRERAYLNQVKAYWGGR